MWNMDKSYGKAKMEQSDAGPGGFVNTSALNSPNTTGERKRSDRFSNIVPCTIAQILLMPENEDYLKVGSLVAKIVTFIGIVKSVDVQSTKVSCVIDDCTGPGIEVQIWVGENEDQGKKISCIQENTYVRVTGAIRSMKGKRHIIGFKIIPIKDANEVTMHILECIHTGMSVVVMDKQAASGTTHHAGASTAVLTGITPMSLDTINSASQFTSRLSKPQQLVYQAISACKEEQGISTFELFNNIKSLTRQAAQEALEFLSNEGHIYSTIDEDHYKSTDSV